MSQFLQSAVLGLVQGLTEFIPVSSSAHLLLIPAFFGWSANSLAFDTTLHLGTSAALIVYFYNDFKTILISIYKDVTRLSSQKKFDLEQNTKLGISLILGSIPALILGFLFNDYFENVFRNISWTFYFILCGTLLMFIAEYLYSKNKSKQEKGISNVNYKTSILIGFFQSLALFPGFSRSGSTISAGMLLGLSKETSARFSFLLSLPIILSAGIYQLISNPISDLFSVNTLIGFIFSFVSGLYAIKFLIGYLKNNKLYPFVIYRIILAFLVILFLKS